MGILTVLSVTCLRMARTGGIFFESSLSRRIHTTYYNTVHVFHTSCLPVLKDLGHNIPSIIFLSMDTGIFGMDNTSTLYRQKSTEVEYSSTYVLLSAYSVVYPLGEAKSGRGM